MSPPIRRTLTRSYLETRHATIPIPACVPVGERARSLTFASSMLSLLSSARPRPPPPPLSLRAAPPLYFTTLERLRFAQCPEGNLDTTIVNHSFAHHRSHSSPSKDRPLRRPPILHFAFGSDDLDAAPCPLPLRDDRSSRAPPPRPEQLRIQRRESHGPSPSHRRRQKFALEAARVASIGIDKRTHETLDADMSDTLALTASVPSAAREDAVVPSAEVDVAERRDSLYDCFRRLDGDALDLTLHLDDYDFDLRGDTPEQSTHLRPYLRRRLSVSKLPTSHRASSAPGRPASKDSDAPPMSEVSSASLTTASSGRVSRSSRARSFISPKRRKTPVDVATDADAPTKLRLNFSEKGFDEAAAFDFFPMDDLRDEKVPSVIEVTKPATFLADDMSSLYNSSEISAAESESPRTPESLDKPLPPPPVTDADSSFPNAAYAQQLAPSEVTLRMTLTRPDLRTNDDQMYGWQQKKASAGRRQRTKDDMLPPLPYSREGYSKESIERQFAAMDLEQLEQDDGVVKRFWNRVRRS
ncbi:hypothetical protein RJ55_02487 [Drechmeria coniospora]|nr:hypothetical protein RJ55_02487 [Drechmeria coniospora]